MQASFIGEWKSEPNLPFRAVRPACTVFQDQMWVFDAAAEQKAYTFDFIKSKWQQFEIPFALEYPHNSVANIDDSLYLVSASNASFERQTVLLHVSATAAADASYGHVCCTKMVNFTLLSFLTYLLIYFGMQHGCANLSAKFNWSVFRGTHQCQ